VKGFIGSASNEILVRIVHQVSGQSFHCFETLLAIKFGMVGKTKSSGTYTKTKNHK